METKETSLCRRCGRKLRSEESKARGMGETCYKKSQSEAVHKKLYTLQTPKTSI